MRQFAITLALFTAALVPRLEAETVFHYTSEAGDYIGLGQERTLTPADGFAFQVSNNSPSNVAIYINGGAPNFEFYSINFSALKDGSLALGDYPDATLSSVPSPVHPGLDFMAPGRGCNTLTGQFQILQISFDADGKLTAFAADFVQHCEDAAPASYGQIRYNSSIPSSNPAGVGQLNANHYTVFARDGGLTVGVTRRDGSTGPLTVNYATADSADLAGKDYTPVSGSVSWAAGETADKSFTIPILKLGDPSMGNGTFLVHLSGAGIGAQTQATVTVIRDNSAITFVHFVSDADDFIGQGMERTFSIAQNYVLKVSRNFGGGVSFYFDNAAYVEIPLSEWWTLDFASAVGTIFGVGDYLSAQSFPSQETGHPGIDLSGQGRSNDSATGSFRVLEAVFDSNGNVLKFAADFEQHSGGGPAATRGQVRYNSTVPIPTLPEISVLASVQYTLEKGGEPGEFTLKRTGDLTNPLTVKYQLTGTALNGRNYARLKQKKTFKAGNATLRLKIRPIDVGRNEGKSTVLLTLVGKPDLYTVAPIGISAKVKIFNND